MTETPAIATLCRDIVAGNNAAVERQFANPLLQVALDPAWCHFVGLYYFWRALDAEKVHDGARAEGLWRLAIPPLVYALEQDEYLQGFRAARETVYEQAIPEAKMMLARDSIYAWIEAKFEELRHEYSELNRDEERSRLQQIADQMKLERIAARLVKRIGGIPTDITSGAHVVAGPAFARLRGFYRHAQDHIAGLEVREKSLFDQLVELLQPKKDEQSGEITTQVKREAGYCFSALDFAYLCFSEKQYSRALDALTRMAEAGGESEVRAVAGMVSEAAKGRMDARQLAMSIRVAVGTERLHEDGSQAKQGLDYWGEALKDAEVLDANTSNPLERRTVKIREHMQHIVHDRVDHLVRMNRWDEALVLAEGLTRIIPRESALANLVHLIVQRAGHCAKQNDHQAAMELLRRARLLRPNDSQLRQYLLISLVHCSHQLVERKEHRAIVEHGIDIIGLAREILGSNPKDSEAPKMGMIAAMWINESAPKLDPERDAGLLNFARAAIGYQIGQIPPMDYSQIEGVRYANRAYDRAQEGKFTDAFGDAEEAIRRNPKNDQICRLYAAVAARAVDELCNGGALDRASEIAERAHQTSGADSQIAGCRTRVMLRRLDCDKLLSENPEDIATLVTMVTSWLGQTESDAGIREKARRFGAILDPALQNERKLYRVQQLMNIHRWQEALKLARSLKVTGRDELLARYHTAFCLYHLQDLAGALVVAEQLVEECPHIPFMRLARGKLLSYAGRFAEAEADLMAYREHDDENHNTLLELAMNSFRAGRLAEAAADARLARQNGVLALQTILIECFALMEETRDREIPVVLAQTPEKYRNDPEFTPLLRWMAGEMDDEAFGRHEDAQGGNVFWLGVKLRLRGEVARGNALVEKSLARGATHTYEYEHALAMKNGGRLAETN